MIKAGEIKIRQGVFWTAKDSSENLAPTTDGMVLVKEVRNLSSFIVEMYYYKESVK